MTDTFAKIFRLNVERRSRTAKGQDKGGETSSKKKPLLLSGEPLAAKVRANTETLILDVQACASVPWADAELIAMGTRSRSDVPNMCERWFDIVNDGLYGPDAYAEEFRAVERDAERLGRTLGRRLAVNRRYRIWTPGYTTMQVAPALLEEEMDAFYARLARDVWHLAKGRRSDKPPDDRDVAGLMAYADVMMDGELHPWLDGCSRVSTALVMWIACLFRHDPPLFAETKKEHYETIRDLDLHTDYFVSAILRGRAFPG